MLQRLRRVERLGEEVLTDKQQSVELDRQRQLNREALAALRRAERQGQAAAAAEKRWVCLGDFFVRRDHGTVRSQLEAEQQRLDCEIERLRLGITRKTSELCSLDPSIA